MARNANEAIADADWDNDEPNGQFVLVTYQATYNGPDRVDDVEDWIWLSFVGSDNVAYGESFEDTPLEAQGLYALDIGRGETVTDQALFDVPRHVIDGGAISLTAWDSDNEDKEYYAAFTF